MEEKNFVMVPYEELKELMEIRGRMMAVSGYVKSNRYRLDAGCIFNIIGLEEENDE